MINEKNLIQQVKFIRKLGSGAKSIVYLVRFKNKQYAMGIRKGRISDYDNELNFYKCIKNMSSEHKKYFCKLYYYEEIDRHIINQFPDEYMDSIKRLENAKNGLIYLLSYEGNTTLKNFNLKKLSFNEKYNLFLQIKKINRIMLDLNFCNPDLHWHNIMVKKVENNYQIVAIDFNHIDKINNKLNKNYILSQILSTFFPLIIFFKY